jgi:hypothetical protein
VGCYRALGQSDPRIGIGVGRDAQAGGIDSRATIPRKNALARAFLLPFVIPA